LTAAPIDVARVRHDTPGCLRVAHFNNAGAALPPGCVVDAQVEHLRREAAIGGYEAADEAAERLEAVYASLARLLGCRSDEVALAPNATLAWDMVIYGMRLGPGDRILTSRAEYGSNCLAFLQIAARTGAVVEAVPDDAAGQLSVDALRETLDERVKVISVSHVPTSGGLVQPAAAIGAVARAAGVPFVLDACQSAGQLPLDVDALGCDVLTATGRKYLRGPRGVGFLYVRRTLLERLEPAFVDVRAARWVAPNRYELRADARRFESWERSPAAALGLGAAVDYALDLGLDAIWRRVQELAAALRRGLGALPGVHVRDRGATRCGLVGFTVEGVAADEVLRALRALGIHVSVSRQGSTPLDLPGRGLEALVRASVHYYNTAEEVARLCAAVAAL
jgi:cysteine desulfurase / selenocysteine lyase